MEGLFNFLSPEAGQRRTKWLNDAINDNLSYFLGPTGIDSRLSGVAEMNPVNDIYRAGGDMRDGDYVGAAVNTATAAAPLAATPFMKGGGRAAAETLEDVLTGVSVGARGAGDAAKRFATDESGGVRLFRGTNGSEKKITGGIAEGELFATPYEDVAKLYGDKIEELELVDNARILVEGTPEFAKVTGRRKGPLLRTMRQGENIKTAADDAAAKAKAAGYDALEFNSMRDMGTVIFNRDALVQSDLYGGLNKSALNKLPPAQEQAQTVLDLLRAGNADQVTDDMMAAADDMYLFENYDLPMDEASRMARADGMGFDTDAYHGTLGTFDAFDGRSYSASNFGTHMGSKDAADVILKGKKSRYDKTPGDYIDGSQVIPVRRGGNHARISDTENWGPDTVMSHLAWGDETADHYKAINESYPRFDADELKTKHIEETLKGRGVDGFVYENLYEGGGDSAVTFDPSNIRSRFARFDPRLAHLRNLSAGVGGISAYNAMTAEEKNKEKVRKYLKGGT